MSLTCLKHRDGERLRSCLYPTLDGMVYRRANARRDRDGSLVSLYRGRTAGVTLVVAVVEHKDMLTVYDNGDNGERGFPDRLLWTGGLGAVSTRLGRLGIAYTTPEIKELGKF